MQRNGQKHDKNLKEKNGRKTVSPPSFFCKRFLTWTFPIIFNGVFELPLLRNAPKRHERK
jgi:hypothetical protein